MKCATNYLELTLSTPPHLPPLIHSTHLTLDLLLPHLGFLLLPTLFLLFIRPYLASNLLCFILMLVDLLPNSFLPFISPISSIFPPFMKEKLVVWCICVYEACGLMYMCMWNLSFDVYVKLVVWCICDACGLIYMWSFVVVWCIYVNLVFVLMTWKGVANVLPKCWFISVLANFWCTLRMLPCIIREGHAEFFWRRRPWYMIVLLSLWM